MKKLLGIIGILCLIISCDADDQEVIELQHSDLKGSWLNTRVYEQGEQLTKFTYTFKGEGTFEGVSTYNDSQTEEILGYSYLVTGTYTLTRDSLTFLRSKQFYIAGDTPEYVERIADLTLRNIAEKETVGYSITENRSKLSIKYKPCGPTENCVGESNFLRVQ